MTRTRKVASRAEEDPVIGPVLERICADRARASRPTIKLLDCFEARLFDHHLTINLLKAEAGVNGSGIESRFRLDVGSTPGRYLADLRLEIAAGLLRLTDKPIQEVARFAGYNSPQSFSRAFKRWSNKTPRDFREQEARGGPPARILTRDPAGDRIRDSSADLDDVKAQLHALQARYRLIEDDPPRPDPAAKVVDAARYMRACAREEWQQIETRSFEEQLDYVRHRVCFTSPELFELLLAKSRESRDASRAVELARLALASLDASAEFLDDRLLKALRERGRGRLENAWQREKGRIFLSEGGTDLAEIPQCAEISTEMVRISAQSQSHDMTQ